MRPDSSQPQVREPIPPPRIVEVYTYEDEEHTVLFEVCRLDPKGFIQRRPNGAGGYTYTLDGARRVLYRLPRVIDAVGRGQPIFIVEGEKDVHAVEKHGGVGTCNPGGAAQWEDEYSTHYTGAKGDIVIVADKDQPGHKHAERVRSSLRRVAGVRARLVEAAVGKDASDHLEAGLGLQDFVPLPVVSLAGTTPDELLDFNAEHLRFAVPHLAIRGNTTMFYATVGAGKRTLYQDALVATSVGRKFLNLLEFEEPQRFLVFDWENSKDQVGRSLKRLGLQLGGAGFTYYFSPEGVDLDTPKGRDRIVELALGHEATCLIFDNRDAAFPHTKEIEGADIAVALMATKKLAVELDVAIVILSHEPKADYTDSTAKLRGHSAWGAFSDQLFRLRRNGGLRLLEHARPRGMDRLPALEVKLVTEGEPHIGPMHIEATYQTARETIVAARRHDDVRILQDYLEEHGPARRGKFKTAMAEQGIGDTRFREALRESRRIGQPAGKGTEYCIVPEGEQHAEGGD